MTRNACPPARGNLFQLAPVGVALVGVTGPEASRIVEVNRAFSDLFGAPQQNLVGSRICDLVDARDAAGSADLVAQLVAGAASSVEREVNAVGPDRRARWVGLTASFVRQARQGQDAIVVTARDSSERRRLADERNDLAQRLAEAQSIARIGSFDWEPADAAVISDEVFGLFGLPAQSLPGTFAAWEPYLHPDDLPALTEAVTGTLADGLPRDVEFRFKRARNGFRWAEGRVHAALSGGRVIRMRGTMQDIHERKLAEISLRQQLADIEEAAGLRAALADGQFRLDGQPITAVRSSAHLADELLLRLVDSSGRIVPAADFLGLAEKHRVISDLDLWVLDQAVGLAAGGSAVAVNVSARTISDCAYADEVVRLLDERGADPAKLTFEITETALVESFDEARRFALRLESLGCRLALDDFGTGYGALTYLKQIPAHYLKIDREFVADVNTNARSRAVVRGVVNLARNFGQQTIAEGVEDLATLETVGELGVDFVQGYYIGRPAWAAGAGRGR